MFNIYIKLLDIFLESDSDEDDTSIEEEPVPVQSTPKKQPFSSGRTMATNKMSPVALPKDNFDFDVCVLELLVILHHQKNKVQR